MKFSKFTWILMKVSGYIFFYLLLLSMFIIPAIIALNHTYFNEITAGISIVLYLILLVILAYYGDKMENYKRELARRKIKPNKEEADNNIINFYPDEITK